MFPCSEVAYRAVTNPPTTPSSLRPFSSLPYHEVDTETRFLLSCSPMSSEPMKVLFHPHPQQRKHVLKPNHIGPMGGNVGLCFVEALGDVKRCNIDPADFLDVHAHPQCRSQRCLILVDASNGIGRSSTHPTTSISYEGIPAAILGRLTCPIQPYRINCCTSARAPPGTLVTPLSSTAQQLTG